MSLRGAIARMGGASYLVTRTGPGSDDGHGGYIGGDPTTVPIVASVQPLTGLELKDASEGRYGDDIVQLWTETELVAVDDDKGIAGDELTYNDKPYTVIKVAKWSSFGGAHYICNAAYTGLSGPS